MASFNEAAEKKVAGRTFGLTKDDPRAAELMGGKYSAKAHRNSKESGKVPVSGSVPLATGERTADGGPRTAD